MSAINLPTILKSSVIAPLFMVGLTVIYSTYKEDKEWKLIWKSMGYATGTFLMSAAGMMAHTVVTKTG